MKRLDDNNDTVRLAALRAFAAFVGCLRHRSYDAALYKAHLEFMFRGLLVHLDDPQPDIQAAVAGVLDQTVPLSPTVLMAQIVAIRDKHREPKHCDALLARAEAAAAAAGAGAS